MKAILVLAVLFSTWMVWPDLSQRFAERVDALPSLPTLQRSKPAPEITDQDIIYHGAKQWDPFTAPTGYENTPVKVKTTPSASRGQGDGGCNRTLPNSGRCDSLQYHSGSITGGGTGIANRDLL